MSGRTVSVETKAGRVEGICDTRFADVLDTFVANFERRGEIGASVAITVEGRTLVDLWGGRKSKDGEPWTADTMCIVFSSTKGALALAAHMLVDRGLLDLDALIVDLWPEFGQGGKETALVSMALDHSAGVPHFRQKLEPGSLNDYARMVEVVAAEEAFWEPGTRNGYQAMTMAWTVGEIVRRAAGKRFGAFFRDEVAGPLGIDFWVGLPEELEPRVARIHGAKIDPSAPPTRFVAKALADRNGPSGLFLRDTGRLLDVNSRACHAAEIGSANGITNGRGLAGMYAPLANGGAIGATRLVGSEKLTRMSRVAVATHEDATLRIPTRFALGFMKSIDNRKLDNSPDSSVILSEPAFGHVGAGGSIGFADPECRMSFGYTMNQMGLGILLNARGQSLVDAAYHALGYRTNAGGAWTM
jgi:CubicO group peptidase (beta-lactamase class C family)